MKHILAMLLALLGASGALAQIYVKVVLSLIHISEPTRRS